MRYCALYCAQALGDAHCAPSRRRGGRLSVIAQPMRLGARAKEGYIRDQQRLSVLFVARIARERHAAQHQRRLITRPRRLRHSSAG